MANKTANKKGVDINAIAQAAATEAARLAYGAGSIQKAKTAGNVYKETEKRLYAYPDLLEKIEGDKEKLTELMEHGAPSRSASVVRFQRSGVRLSPEEILDGIVQDLNATIAADQHEADTIAVALDRIKGDQYYAVIAGKFIEYRGDEEIAAAIPCDPSTVRRNRGRLRRPIAVWLYGAQAV